MTNLKMKLRYLKNFTMFFRVDNEFKERVVNIHVDKPAVWKFGLKRVQRGSDLRVE